MDPENVGGTVDKTPQRKDESQSLRDATLLTAISELTIALREHTTSLKAGSGAGGWQRSDHVRSLERPTYIKIARKHLDIRALEEAGYPWEFASDDANYIIIKRLLSHDATQALFARTLELRNEDAVSEPQRSGIPTTDYPHGDDREFGSSPAGDDAGNTDASTVEVIDTGEGATAQRRIRVHKDALEVDTLLNFHGGFAVDPDDRNFNVLAADPTKDAKQEIEALFAHTRAIRQNRQQHTNPEERETSRFRQEIDDLVIEGRAVRQHGRRRRSSSGSESFRIRPSSPTPSNNSEPPRRGAGASKLQNWKPTILLSTDSKAVKRMQEIKTPFGPKMILPAVGDNPLEDYAAKLDKQSWLQRMTNHGVFSTFESSQYMLLHHMQNRLARETSSIMAELKLLEAEGDSSFQNIDSCFERLDALLETYFNALRRLRWSMDQDQPSWSEAEQYMIKQVQEFNGTGLESSWFHDKSAFMDINRPGEKADALRMLLVKHLPISLTATDRERMQALQKVWKEGTVKPEQTHLPTGFNGFIDRLVRFTAAMVGASMLLVPVIIMIYVHDQHWRLGITCFAAIICALFLAFLTNSGPSEVFGGTAGYVGLLIVFLGVSG